MTDEPIRIRAYDAGWPAKFGRERDALVAAIGELVPGGIHHVGSTAVPGLEAKPTVDILAGVESLAASRAAFGSLADLGYLYSPYLPAEMHWFCKPDPARREFHLHLIPTSGRRYDEELAFRDRLRADPALAAAYAALKRDLATRFEHDREAYTDAKATFVRTAVS